MQLGLLNILLGLPSGATGQGQGDKAAPGNDLFSLLLGDSGTETGQPGSGALPEIFATDVSPAALTAQEVPVENTPLDTLTDLLSQPITAEDATALLAKIDTLPVQADPDQQVMLQQVREVLTTIRDTKVPQTLGAVMAQIPVAQHGAHGAALERMLAWVKDTIITPQDKETTQDVAAVESADTEVSPLVQSLQVSIFRDGEDDTAQTQEKTGSDTAATTTAAIIIPLAFQTAAQAPAWIKKIGATPVREDIDAAVPPLTLAKNEALPEVTLPSTTEKAPVDTGKDNFADRLKALSGDITPQNAAQAPVADSVADDAANAVNGVHATTATHTSDHRVLSIGNSSHGALNHAPVAEQVQVAVTRGAKDGMDQLTIQLDPVDLGRVEVKMHTGADGQTQISFLVDKAETLDSLSRDARSLERALQDAGIKADTGSMQFNLRQQPQPQGGTGDGQQGSRNNHNGDDEDIGPQASAISAITTNYTLTLRDGVDIQA